MDQIEVHAFTCIALTIRTEQCFELHDIFKPRYGIVTGVNGRQDAELMVEVGVTGLETGIAAFKVADRFFNPLMYLFDLLEVEIPQIPVITVRRSGIVPRWYCLTAVFFL